MGVLGRRQQGLLTQKAQQGLRLDNFITKFQGFALLAALFSLRMCIPTRVVSPAVTSTAGFLRANIARMNKVLTRYKHTNKTQSRPNPLSQQQQRRFTSMKPTNVTNSCKSGCKETPACPVVTYLSIISVFSLIMLTNYQHSPTLHPQSR